MPLMQHNAFLWPICVESYLRGFQNIVVCTNKPQRGGHEWDLVLLELHNSSAISGAGSNKKILKFDQVIQVQAVDILVFALLRVTKTTLVLL